MTPNPLPSYVCWQCGTTNDTATVIGDEHARPEPGHASVCFTCGGVGMYDETLRVVRMPRSTFDALPDEAKRQLAQYSAAIVAYQETRAKQ